MTEGYKPAQDFCWHLTPDRPLMPYASAEQQRQAVEDFMAAIEGYVPYTDPGPFCWDWEFGERCQMLANMRQPETNEPVFQGDNLIRLAIACYDYYLADSVRADHNYVSAFPDKADEYFRAAAYWQALPFALRVKRAKKGPLLIQVIGTLAHISMYALEHGMEAICGRLTPDLGFMLCEDGSEPSPPISVPRQMLFASLLRCGHNPLEELDSYFDEDELQTFINRRFVADKNLPAIGWHRQDSRSALSWAHCDEQALKERYQACARYWGRVLASQSFAGKPQSAALFSSGTAANETAMRVVAENAANADVFMHPYWYHENIPTAQKLFQLTQNIDEAKVLLVNPEPVSYFRFEGDVISPAHAIKRFLTNAQQHPRERYYLIADVTVDPFYSVPHTNNVELIKTMSATKHQNGSRRYFFGAALGEDATVARMNVVKESVGGDMNDYRIMHFPRSPNIYDNEDIEALQHRREHIVAMNMQLETLNSSDPASWMIKPYSYFSFIFPPQAFVRAVARNMAGKEDPRDDWINEVNLKIAACIKRVILETEAMDFGQSFGLYRTRINAQGCITTVDGARFRLRIPRLCPGFGSDIDSTKSAVRVLLGYLNELTV